jgi:hypothetical protein
MLARYISSGDEYMYSRSKFITSSSKRLSSEGVKSLEFKVAVAPKGTLNFELLNFSPYPI